MRIAITGASGFIAANLRVRLVEIVQCDVSLISRDISDADLSVALTEVQIVYHLAGVNRPDDPTEFATGNVGFSKRLCGALSQVAPDAHVVYTSSTQAEADNDYGRSKRAAEDVVLAHNKGNAIFRLPNVFGKWARPNYNSAVATFCHNVARGLPIIVNDPAAALKLVYIDDVVDAFLAQLNPITRQAGQAHVTPVYSTMVGAVAEMITEFRDSRTSLITPRVGTGLTRALYSTYVAALPTDSFAYDVPMHSDPRGTFVEMLKTLDCGQFSFFTAHPGVTRGEHYHHSKTEKFLVIQGQADFGFRHIETGEIHHILTSGDKAQIVETVPGWTHNITNIGEGLMTVMLWANEIFNREKPDTFAMKVDL